MRKHALALNGLISMFKQNDKAENSTLSGILIALVIIVVGLALYPTVQESTNESEASAGDTPAGNLLGLMPLFFVLILLAAVLRFVVFS